MAQDQTAIDKLKLGGKWDFAVRCNNDEQFQEVLKWCLNKAKNFYSSGESSYESNYPIIGIIENRLRICVHDHPFKRIVPYNYWHQIVNFKNSAADNQITSQKKSTISEQPKSKVPMIKVIVVSGGGKKLILKPEMDVLVGQLEWHMPQMEDWELGDEYTISMQEIPQSEFDALHEFDGFF